MTDRKEYFKKYREKNKDKRKEYCEKNKEYFKEYREKNKDKKREYQKEYMKEYFKKTKEYQKEYQKKYREENKNNSKEYQKEYWKKYYGENKEKKAEYAKNHKLQYYNTQHKRRARMKFTDIDSKWLKKLYEDTNTCEVCNRKMKDKSIDHILPLNVGGLHIKSNVRIICLKCNLQRPKNGSDIIQFRLL